MSRPVHFEILANDPEVLAGFYEKLLGWKIERWAGGPPYWIASTGSDETPGIDGAFMTREFQQAIINTIEIESLEKSLDHLKKLGGKVIHGPNEIPGVGTHAYCADPEGIMFGLLEPKRPND